MNCSIRKVRPGDEGTLAQIQTESWKAAFRGVLSNETLQRSADISRSTAMYRRLLDGQIGNGYLMEVDGKPHAIAWWDRARDADVPDDAELICIHSLPDNWGKGYGTKLMNRVLSDIRAAGYSKVMLWVFAENARARRFYEACGFVTTGTSRPCLGAQEIRCERRLAPAADVCERASGRQPDPVLTFRKTDGFHIMLSEDQYRQISSPARIRAALAEENVLGFDIFLRDAIVGFAMLRRFEAEAWFLWDFAIDAAYQNRKLGTLSLRMLMELMRTQYHAKRITTTYLWGNDRAKHVYESLGFVETDVVDEPGIHEVNMSVEL